MSFTAPDVSGFLDAQRRLRDKMGQDVDFMVPEAAVWPLDTPLDEDGSPYDPTIAPASGGGFATVRKRVCVIFKKESPLRPGADTRFQPAGEFSGIDVILDLDVDDHLDVQNATQVWMNTLKFRIVEWKPMGLGGVRRYSVYLEEL